MTLKHKITHINPGPAVMVNPVVINDTYRERPGRTKYKCVYPDHCSLHDHIDQPCPQECGDCKSLRPASDPTIRKSRTVAQVERDQIVEQLNDLRRYSSGEYEEAYLSDNEREMRIHVEYGNRIWEIMKSIKQRGEPE